MDHCDVFISGGGIAGLTAAAAFGAAGFSVICADPAPPVVDAASDGADLRTTALLQPARHLLSRAGLWDRLAAHAAPLQIMRIVDASGDDATPRVIKDFNAAELSDAPFGWNFPNWLLRREIVARLSDIPQVDFRPGLAATGLLTRTREARVRLSDGTQVTAQLVIGADGRDSPMRTAAGIGAQTTRYGQKALAFAVTHPIPHDGVSTEIHRSGGPFTLVPLPDREGLPCSAVVWMDDGPATLARAAMNQTSFEADATERSAALFGPLTLVSPRQVWPIISRHADRLVAERLALVAEAAHALPPIGAQGLNMSLTDITTLLDLALSHRDTLGDRAMLEAYQEARSHDIRLRMAGIDLLNRASRTATPALQQARAAGIEALYGLKPVRQMLMQMGLGVK